MRSPDRQAPGSVRILREKEDRGPGRRTAPGQSLISPRFRAVSAQSWLPAGKLFFLFFSFLLGVEPRRRRHACGSPQLSSAGLGRRWRCVVWALGRWVIISLGDWGPEPSRGEGRGGESRLGRLADWSLMSGVLMKWPRRRSLALDGRRSPRKVGTRPFGRGIEVVIFTSRTKYGPDLRRRQCLRGPR